MAYEVMFATEGCRCVWGRDGRQWQQVDEGSGVGGQYGYGEKGDRDKGREEKQRREIE
jgi:hypothetical protein